MIINCALCGNVIEIPVELQEGQHVICPYCHRKFSFSCDDNLRCTHEHNVHSKMASLFVKLYRLFVQGFAHWFSLYKTMFSFSGKIDRRQYAEFIIIQYILHSVIGPLRWHLFTIGYIVPLWLIGGLYVVLMFPIASVVAKRLHDANKPTWGAWVALALALLLHDYTLFFACLLIAGLILKSQPSSGGRESITIQFGKRIFLCLLIVYPICRTIYVKTKVNHIKEEIEAEIKERVPFNKISWTLLDGDGSCDTYIFNTDGPAHAQVMAIYVMGRLQQTQTMQGDNSYAVEEYIRNNFELEGSLRRK